MSNETVKEILAEAQRFWVKWRDKVPPKESEQWESLVAEADSIKTAHGSHLVRKWEGPVPSMEEEPVAAPIVNWFMDELETRERKLYGGEG